ncbi:metallopeptidase family protein [Candidatus Saccharibacteria bacterium]|nr:metallopeptidase family protein [Candidatus Saccharibacteria bacterium]
MVKIHDTQFEKIVAGAIDAIPSPYIDRLENVAFIVESEPTQQQAKMLGLRCHDLLFGLYEGVPLPRRMGATKLLPDKITLFKNPLLSISKDMAELTTNIKHTIWHEVAHYYGLNHDRIHEIENKKHSKRHSY